MGWMADVSAAEATDTIERILDATVAVVADRGLDATTMKMIADRAGVSKSLLHYHFQSKEELLVQALNHMARNVVEQARTTEACSDRSVERAIAEAREAFGRLQSDATRLSFFTAMYAGGIHSDRLASEMQHFHRQEEELIQGLIFRSMGPEAQQNLNLGIEQTIRLVQTVIIGLIILRSLGADQSESMACFDDLLFLLTAPLSSAGGDRQNHAISGGKT